MDHTCGTTIFILSAENPDQGTIKRIKCNYCPNCFVIRAVGDMLSSIFVLEMGRCGIRKSDMLNEHVVVLHDLGSASRIYFEIEEYIQRKALIWQ